MNTSASRGHSFQTLHRQTPYEIGFGGFRKHGFTLLELLVVMAIISLMVAFLLPALRLAKDSARTSLCSVNQRQCGYALTGYAMDFKEWMLGGQCDGTHVANPTLGGMMLENGYCPAPVNGKSASGSYLKVMLAFGTMFQCPSMPPPGSYRENGINYPYSGNPLWNCSSNQSYGLRVFSYANYFPGEIQTSTSADKYFRLIKLSSLYKPSDLPYMADAAASVTYPNGTGVLYIQYKDWDIGTLHLRHNARAVVWFPDGHVGNWGADEASDWYRPGAGTLGTTTPLGYGFWTN